MPQSLGPTGAPSVFGGIGRLEWSAGNPDDPFPVWQDITVFVRTEDNPLRINRGRQTELDQTQPSQLTCDLDNTDNRFTFGYTGGPYGATWTPAKKVRYTETIGGRTFVLFTGWIEFPDVNNWQPTGYQTVQLTCTDRLTRLARGRKFVSNLGEHILYNVRNSALKNYWTLSAPSNRFPPITGKDTLAPDLGLNPGGPTLTISPQGGPSLPGDDLSPVLINFSDGIGADGTVLTGTLSSPITLSGTNALTLLLWVRRVTDFSAAQPQDMFALFATDPTTGAITDAIEIYVNNTGGPRWRGGGQFGGGASSIDAGPIPETSTGRWMILGLQFTLSPQACTLWVDGQTIAGVVTGSPPASVTVSHTWIGNNWCGNVAHAQIYYGAPADFTRTDFLAQRQMGLYGLEWQLPGQRVNTILDYAGVLSTDRAVDPGVSYMQQAKLAGQDPLTAIQNAVTTERGRFFAGGDGRAVFHDRIRILNV